MAISVEQWVSEFSARSKAFSDAILDAVEAGAKQMQSAITRRIRKEGKNANEAQFPEYPDYPDFYFQSKGKVIRARSHRKRRIERNKQVEYVDFKFSNAASMLDSLIVKTKVREKNTYRVTIGAENTFTEVKLDKQSKRKGSLGNILLESEQERKDAEADLSKIVEDLIEGLFQ